MKADISPAREYIEHAWQHTPRSSSDQRRTHAVSSSLRNAIRAGMRFEPDDFKRIDKGIGMGWIVGAEGLDPIYSLACGSERATANPSAVAALEKFLGRHPFLWAEKSKTAERLRVGSDFTWKGHRVCVTSFARDQKSLVACCYKNWRPDKARVDVGDTVYFQHKYRIVEAFSDLSAGSIAVRLSAPFDNHESREIAKRFTITASELKEARGDYDGRRRAHQKAIAAAQTLEALDAARLAASAEGTSAYRHFDIEIINEAISIADKRIRGQMSREDEARDESNRRLIRQQNLDRWRAGDDVRDFLSAYQICIRIKNGFVEVSNGNKVTVAAARATLAFVKRHRAKGWHRLPGSGTDHDVDAFPLRNIGSEGVQIGCTLIPWGEVDRCAELLESEK